MSSIRMISVAVVVTAISAGCASSTKQLYVEPSQQTILSSSEDVLGVTPGRVLYMENRSTVPITVTGVTLRSCRNIKQPCDQLVPLAVRVDPGHRVPYHRVEPLDRRDAYDYRAFYRWRPDSRLNAQRNALAEGGVEAEEIAAIGRRLPEGVSRGPAMIVKVAVEPDTLEMQVGEAVTLEAIRFSMVVRSPNGDIPAVVYPFRGRVVASGAVAFVAPDSLRATAPGIGVVELLPLERLVTPRIPPLAPARLTVIVRE